METESAWDTQSVFPHFKAQDLELGFNHADDVNDVVDQAFEGESASLMSEEPCETPTSPPSARRLAQPARARQPLVEVKCEPSRVSRADRMREDDKCAFSHLLLSLLLLAFDLALIFLIFSSFPSFFFISLSIFFFWLSPRSLRFAPRPFPPPFRFRALRWSCSWSFLSRVLPFLQAGQDCLSTFSCPSA